MGDVRHLILAQAVAIYFIHLFGFCAIALTYFGHDNLAMVTIFNFSGANIGYILGAAYYKQERQRLGPAQRY